MPEGKDRSFSPYKGLIFYDEGDAGFFFGRRADTRLIIANLFAYPLTLLFGVSGVGKSSVLRAGVAHALRKRDDVLTLVYADWKKDPLLTLKSALTKAVYERARETNKNVDKLPSTNDELSVCLEQSVSIAGCRVMVLLDQFEDYLQYYPVDHPFADEFAKAVMHPNLPVSFLISIREDTFAKLDRFEGSVPIIFNNYLRLEHLNRKAAAKAITQPILLYNDIYKRRYEIEPGLIEAVLESVGAERVPFRIGTDDLKAEERGDRFSTIFLQLVMSRLWKEEKDTSSKLRKVTLQKLKGVEGIVQNHIDNVMSPLTIQEKEYASVAYQYLVTPSGTKFAYSARELARQQPSIGERQIACLEQTLQKLSSGESPVLHQVTLKTEIQEPQYEICHTPLGPALLDWRIRFLQEQNEIEYKEKLAIERKLEQEEAERRWRRSFRTAVAIAIGLFLLTAASIIVINIVARTAQAREEARRQLKIEKEKADRALRIVRQQDRAIKYTEAVLRGHSGPVVAVAFSPDGKYVMTGSDDQTAIVWNVSTGELIAFLSLPAAVTSVAYSPDGRFVVTSSKDNITRLWNSTDWSKKPVEMNSHTDTVNKVVFSADGKHIATASADGTARIWKVGETVPKFILRGHTGSVNTVEFSSNGDRVVTSSSDATARVWDSNTGEQVALLAGHTEVVNSASFNLSGNRIVTASSDTTARIWDASTGKKLLTLNGHEGSVNYAEFKSDGEMVVTASSDRKARIWRAGTGELLNTLHHTDVVNNARFSHDGQRVVTASDDKTARVWSTRGQKQSLVAELNGHLDRVTSATFSSDDNLIATISTDQTTRIFSTNFSNFRVSQAKVDAIDYSGPCPSVVQMRGSIDTLEGKGTIVYRFVRGDGVTTPRRELEIDSSQPTWWVIENLRVGFFNTPTYTRYHLEVSEPVSVESPPMKLRLRCTPLPQSSPPPSATPAPSPS